MASTPTQSAATGAASSAAGLASGLSIATGVVDVAATIATTINSISDVNKRRLIESNLNILSEKEKQALAQQIARSNNKNDQATILINTVLAARNAAADRQERSQTIQWILIGAAGVVTLGILAWYLKN